MKKILEAVSEDFFGKDSKLGVIYTYAFVFGLVVGTIGMLIYLSS